MNLNVNCRFGVSTIYQCRYINCNKCTTLVEDVDNWGQEFYGKSLYAPLDFAVSLKLLIKNNIFKKLKATIENQGFLNFDHKI